MHELHQPTVDLRLRETTYGKAGAGHQFESSARYAADGEGQLSGRVIRIRGQQIAVRQNDRTVFGDGQRIRRNDRCVVGSLNRNGDLSSRSQQICVGDRVREDILQRLANRQSLHSRIRVVDGIRIRAIRIHGDRPVDGCEAHTNVAHCGTSDPRYNSCHRFRITRVHIRIICQHRSVCIRTCRAVQHAACFNRRVAVVESCRGIIRALNRDGDLSRRCQAAAVDHCVGERVGQRVRRRSQSLHGRVRIVDDVTERAIVGNTDRTKRSRNIRPY